jgi:tetratricopeptide (TPR) repeat protein
MMRRFGVVAGLLGLMLGAGRLEAQTDPRLREALRVAQEGGSDSARAIVTKLLSATPTTDSLYPELLYTMGLVSRSVEEMRRNYSRIVVEYTNSSWADDALYRLGLLDYAAGDRASATRNLDRIYNDYPDSPLLPAASEWAARIYFDQKKPAEACRWLTTGMAGSGDDVELRNRLEYLNGRCVAQGPAPAKDTARAATTSPTPASPAARSGFAVQVAAVNTRASADGIVNQLKTAGFTPYVVTEGGLFKVRAGPYPDRPAAMQAAEQIRQKLRTSPFVVKEP